uniref:Uncharacterized protein n=1 Tax=Nelumbo nucifera TaxID=4432 RepID=A0A822Z0I7_NELNU|nr:TPA_asm: hypothetical protein HUJ06_007636 [Nelumbo nucifera]
MSGAEHNFTFYSWRQRSIGTPYKAIWISEVE